MTISPDLQSSLDARFSTGTAGVTQRLFVLLFVLELGWRDRVGWRGFACMETGRREAGLDAGCLKGGGGWFGWRELPGGGGGAGWRHGGMDGVEMRFGSCVSMSCVGSVVRGFVRFTGVNGSLRFGSGLRFGSRPSLYLESFGDVVVQYQR